MMRKLAATKLTQQLRARLSTATQSANPARAHLTGHGGRAVHQLPYIAAHAVQRTGRNAAGVHNLGGMGQQAEDQGMTKLAMAAG